MWAWSTQEVLRTTADEYVARMRPLIASDNQREIRKTAAAFQTKVVAYLDNTLFSSGGAARARSKLSIYTTSHAAYGDVIKIASVLRVRDALAAFNEALPSSIEKFD